MPNADRGVSEKDLPQKIMEKGDKRRPSLLFICNMGISAAIRYGLNTGRCCLLLVVAIGSQAQPVNQRQKTDSLRHLLEQLPEDTSRVMVMLTLGSWYQTNNMDSCDYFLRAGKRLADKIDFTAGKYYYSHEHAVLGYTIGRYEEAMLDAKNGLRFARQLGDSMKVVTMLADIGIVQSFLGNFTEQLDYALQSIAAVESLKDTSALSSGYHNLANCYLYLGQYRKGVDNANHGIALNDLGVRHKNPYVNRIWATAGQCYHSLRMFDSAQYCFERAVRESQRVNDQFAEGVIYGYQCDAFAAAGQLDKMLPAAKKSLALAESLQSRSMKAIGLYFLAYAQFANNDITEARRHVEAALAIARADSLKDELKNSYAVLAFIAARQGDYRTAILARQQADSISEASLNDRVVSRTTELEKKFETARKDGQIRLQQAEIERKNVINRILVAGALGLVLLLTLIYRTYRQRQRLQQQRISELETEKKLAATEAVLKGEEQERTRIAKDLHDGLGGMLSGIKHSLNTMKGNLVMTPENMQAFERSVDMLNSSIKEMRRVAHNMMPEVLVKFGLDAALRDFCNDINQTGALQVQYQSIGMDGAAIEQTAAITVYRIVQELLNNTIKHAGARTALVQLSRTDSTLTVTVEDDGRGFDTRVLQQPKGMGWANIQNRVEFLKGKLDVNSQPDKGTSVLIEMEL